MGKSPCCDRAAGVKKGPWSPEEDKLLVDYIQEKGHCRWRRLPKLAGLNRCGKSCRLRWINYLRPNIKRGSFTDDEEKLVIHLHSILGNKWSSISAKLPGRTDNEIKNYWNTHLRKKLLGMGIDLVTHRRRTELSLLAGLPSLLAAAANLNGAGAAASSWDMNALRVQADAAKFQLLQGLVGALTAAAAPVPTAAAGMDNLMTIHDGSNGGQHGAGACGVDQSMLLQQCQRDGMNNLPALTSSAPASGMPISGVFDGFGAVDGLSSTELGGHGGASGSNVTDVVAPDQECKCNYNGMHISGVFDGFGAGDGLSSMELGGHSGASGSNVTDVVAPRPMVTADQECKCNYNGMHIRGVFDGFGAGDGLSSTELGGHSGASGSNVTDAVAAHPIVAADQECNYNAAAAAACGSVSCKETPASSPFDGLESLNLMGDPNTDGDGGVSCKETPASSPFDGLESVNLMGDLNTNGDWSDLLDSAPASIMHISGMFDGFGAGGRASGSNVTDAVAPQPIVAVDQECNNAAAGGGVSCEKTPASSPYDGLESLNLMGDLNTEGDWKDLLEQMSLLNSNEL